MYRIENWIEQLLISGGIKETPATILRLLILFFGLMVFSLFMYILFKKVILKHLYKLFEKSSLKFEETYADKKMFNYLSHIVPAIIIKISAPTVFGDFPIILPFVVKLTNIYIVVALLTIVLALLKIAEKTLMEHKNFKNKPLMSYFQLIRIILYIVAFILILAILFNKTPVYLLSAFGAMTAVLMLVFKDTILGLVASVQLSSNDMVRVGDWIEMPKYNTDGFVSAINLNTVKVRNWDKTITTIPTYYFISEGVKNWRGMFESGGRRIKRSLLIDTHTVKFIDSQTREQYKKIHLISDYINQRQQEIEDYNDRENIDVSVLINGRRMTNLGVFRKYIECYLKNHPYIQQEMIILVRQLAIDDKGVPLEIYCFTSTTKWVEYESIQSDIFDHLLSAASFFNLSIFQQPSGKDISFSIDKFVDNFKENN
ncbi:MAG TPA: mechanosensitive ion channel domain-containing protein [Bacteroidaceae bacterium]|nr:mechanosensitive ion channel domain-containing protein [Bacteroidaceae bacterium]